ncbi:D-aminoacyl-tRNA deacylase [Viscerimonas tarda]
MRIVIQRVTEACVVIEKHTKSQISRGLLVLVGIEDEDSREDIDWLCNKIVNLRIFDDANKVMNLSVLDMAGEILVVSQFTLHASTKKGNRPSYIRASKPEVAIPLYEAFCETLESLTDRPVQTGSFGADMQVKLVNDGPVTICIDSKNRE